MSSDMWGDEKAGIIYYISITIISLNKSSIDVL